MTFTKLCQEAAGGNQLAFNFLIAANDYLVALWHFMERGQHKHGDFIRLLARTNTLYSLPFYQQHADALQQTVLKTLRELRKSYPKEGMRDLLLAVATLTIGFAEARKLGETLDSE